jgi:hypothetical protein
MRGYPRFLRGIVWLNQAMLGQPSTMKGTNGDSKATNARHAKTHQRDGNPVAADTTAGKPSL